jgi:hypothetical protein
LHNNKNYKTKEHKENSPLPFFMTMRQIEIVSIYDSFFASVNYYIIIEGAACDIQLSEADLRNRGNKKT